MSRQSGEGRRSMIVNIRMTPEQVELIERCSEAEGLTTSEFIRRAVSMHLFDVVGEGGRSPYKREPDLTVVDG